jgi:porin
VAPYSGVVPPAIFGAIGTVILPPVVFTLMVFDSKDAMNQTGFEDPFGDGVNAQGSVTLNTRLFDRSSKHTATATWSSQDGVDLNDLSQLALPPGSPRTLSTTKNRWFGSYAFEQTLWRSDTDPKKAIGLFGKVELADGNPNPMRWSALGGLSGTSPIPGRGSDRFGAGFFYFGVSQDLKDGLRPLLRVRDEFGGEVFYNLAVTPWFLVTADLQVISPAFAADPAVFLGLRAQLKF